MKCRECFHWTKDASFACLPEDEVGACDAIELELDIELHTGWDGGVVGKIETGGNFFCAKFNPLSAQEANT